MNFGSNRTNDFPTMEIIIVCAAKIKNESFSHLISDCIYLDSLSFFRAPRESIAIKTITGMFSRLGYLLDLVRISSVTPKNNSPVVTDIFFKKIPFKEKLLNPR
jgi:hypothetical protein